MIDIDQTVHDRALIATSATSDEHTATMQVLKSEARALSRQWCLCGSSGGGVASGAD